MIGCTCARAVCRSPGKHVLQGQSPAARLTTDPDQVGQWWGGGQPWSVLTVTGAGGIDVVDLSYAALPEAIAAWLAERGFADMPVVAGDDHIQFLTSPGDAKPRYAPLPGGWARKPPHGEVVLLPPSRLPSGRPLTWHTTPTGGSALVPCAALFAALEDLPVPAELAGAIPPTSGDPQAPGRRA